MHRTRKKKKISEITRTLVVCERDRISKLPDEILVHILSFLHMKYAVTTSILSTRWRYLWTWNPSLDFSYCKPKVIDRCLDLHKAPKLRSFKKYCYYTSTAEAEDLNRWLRYSATHSVEELFLCSNYCEDYPVSLFECQTLMQLTLRYGKLSLSVNFCGFKSLVTLCLEKVFIKGEELCTLISTCDQLENLKLIYCSFADKQLKISVTNSSPLRNLEIEDHRSSCRLEIEINAPSLLSFTCRSFNSSWNEDLEGWRRLLSAMTCVRTLFAGDWLFQKSKCRKHLPVPFHDHFVFKNLKKLDVFIQHKESKDYLASFISLLKACPVLETVCLYLLSGLERDRCVSYDKVRLWLKEIDDPIFSHDRLKTLELCGFMSTKTELLLLKFLLEKTIALESLILKLRREINNSVLLRIERALHKSFSECTNNNITHLTVQQREVTMSRELRST